MQVTHYDLFGSDSDDDDADDRASSHSLEAAYRAYDRTAGRCVAVVGQIAIMYNESLPAGQNYFKLQMGKPGTKPSKPILEALSKHQKKITRANGSAEKASKIAKKMFLDD